MKTLFFAIFCLFSLSLQAQTLTLLSPNGGETYAGGQAVTVQWVADSAIDQIGLDLSLDNGATWFSVVYATYNSGRLDWTVPYFNQATSQALLKITARDIGNPPSDVSDAPFTIQAAVPDAYEPNNDMAHATPLGLGDTLRHLWVLHDSLSGDTTTDEDFFAFTAQAGKLVSLNTFDLATGNTSWLNLNVAVMDSMGDIISNRSPFAAPYSGRYYAKTYTWASWVTYSIFLSSSDLGTLALTSPKADTVFDAGQVIPIRWTTDSSLGSVCLEYSLDSGRAWNSIHWGAPNIGAYDWPAIYLHQECRNVFIKISLSDIPGGPFSLAGPFTIRAAAEDAYEPNNDLAHATPISAGDTLKDLWVMRDSLSGDTVTDRDFFVFNAEAGKRIVLQPLHQDNGGTWYNLSLAILDSSGTAISWQPDFIAPYTGRYYAEVYSMSFWLKYDLTLAVGDMGSLVLTAPSAGAQFDGGQKVPIRWTADSSMGEMSLWFSLDSGRTFSWIHYSVSNMGAFDWTAPYLDRECPDVLIKITAKDIVNGPSAVAGPITIRAATPDAYEPNNDRAHATALSAGDTLRQLWVMRDSLSGNTTMDLDFFTFTAQAGELISLCAFNSASPDYGYLNMELQDSTGKSLGWANGRLMYNISGSGRYFCRIYSYSLWTQYDLVLSSVRLVNVDSFSINAGSYDSLVADSGHDTTYYLRLASGITDLTINMQLSNRASGTILTGSLPDDAIALSPSGSVQVKALSIEPTGEIEAAIRSADIIIPYNEDSLGNVPESAIVVRWLNDSTGEWSPIAFTLDTINNLIIAHTTHFSVYGLFIPEGQSFARSEPAAPLTASLVAYPLPANPDVRLSFTVPQAGRVSLTVYSVAGQRVASLADKRMDRGQYSVVWNGRDATGAAAASGVYVARLTLSGKTLQKRILLLK